MTPDALEDLKEFVRHVTELRQSRFGRKVLAQENVALRTTGNWDDVEFVTVDKEEVRSFLLGCRLLIQDNERVSIRNIWGHCEAGMGDSEPFLRINGQRWMLNDYLDQDAPIADHAGNQLTHRTIVWTFIYGSYAHLDRKRAAQLREWQSEPRQYFPLQLLFILALKVLIQTASAISDEIDRWLSINQLQHPRPDV